MGSPTAVVCREVFDENSQPSVEEISEYAQQIGIDTESEGHLLPLAKEGLMRALPPPWEAYYDEKLQTHYYLNKETKKTQWEHPLDNIYKDLVKKARDASVQDDTCASVQELLTSEEYTKHLERLETKVESDEELTTDSDENASDIKEISNKFTPKPNLTLLGRPPLGRIDKKQSDMKFKRSTEGSVPNKPLLRNFSDRDVLNKSLERPKTLEKQQSEIIDLKMHVQNTDEDNFSRLLLRTKADRGLVLSGKGSIFLKQSKSDVPSPDTDKSFLMDSMPKSDPLKGILREKHLDAVMCHKKSDTQPFGKQAYSLDDDRKSVRFKIENLPDPSVSPSSNSSSEQNDGSIISAPIPISSPIIPSPLIPSSPINSIPPVPFVKPLVLQPLVSRPPLLGIAKENIISDKNLFVSSLEKDLNDIKSVSPKKRVLRPPAADYIKPDLFQKKFQKISELVRPGEIDTCSINLEEPVSDNDIRPRSPMIPQKNKISINLMESIEASETSLDSPDRELANLDFNDFDDLPRDEPVYNAKDNVKDKHKTIEIFDVNDTELDENSEKASHSKFSITQHTKTSKENIPLAPIKIPKLDFLSRQTKIVHSDSDDSKHSKTESLENRDIKSPQSKLSPVNFVTEKKCPRIDSDSKAWSNTSFRPLNKAIVSPQIKPSDSITSLGKGLSSPRLDGVIISQGKSTDNVVVVYQFESQSKPKSLFMPDAAGREMMERNKQDERKRLELTLQKDLESIRVEFTTKERRLRAELLDELKENESKFLLEKNSRLNEQMEKHKIELEEQLEMVEQNCRLKLNEAIKGLEKKYHDEENKTKEVFFERIQKIKQDYTEKLLEQKRLLENENDRALTDLYDQLQANLNKERIKMIEENKSIIQNLREEHSVRITDLRNDYRAEVEHLRTQHACHLEELRSRLAQQRLSDGKQKIDSNLAEKYRCLKDKYATLKRDVKMSIERRNNRREISMTTGSETEKSNSNKVKQCNNKCTKDLNETSLSGALETATNKTRANNNLPMKYNDNESSRSEKITKKAENNNLDWKTRREQTVPGPKNERSHRRIAVAFKETSAPKRNQNKDEGTTTDCQDSSEATTADEKSKEALNGHGRRRCFTRLKSASTSRLNYSPKRGEGWLTPLESLRQQLRKLDDLEDQFPDLTCQPSYILRYPFGEIGGQVPTANTPEIEFVKHRALVEREGMRRARAVLKRRKDALRESKVSLSPHRAPSEEREVIELEVALHRARSLLGEKEIRLRHIERALRKFAEAQQTPLIQEATTSEATSGSDEHEGVAGVVAGGAVLRSLNALRADVRDIWRALDASRTNTVSASPENSSNPVSLSQPRMTFSAPGPSPQDNSDGSITERARSLRVWLQTAP